jgi:two-component system, OmpR family, response regulator QseB
MHILLVEDDLDLGQSLQKSLAAEGLSSEWIRRAEEAAAHIGRDHFDCVLLDLSLPDGSGLELLARWRGAGIKTPIIVITARSALEDRLAGLDGGADDFVLKPFLTPELVSRIRAVTRRYAQQVDSVWTCGAIRIDTHIRQVRLSGVEVDLTTREYQILLELVRADGGVVSKDRLAQRLQPLGDPVDFNAIEVHVHNLRRKLGSENVLTVRGVGYRLAS